MQKVVKASLAVLEWLALFTLFYIVVTTVRLLWNAIF